MDSSADWRNALAAQFVDLRFSEVAEIEDPESVNIALIWTIPQGGLEQFRNLRAILSLGAGVSQLELQRFPRHVPLARLVDASLTRLMIDYARTTVYRFHRKLHVFERHSRIGRWQYIAPTLTSNTSVGVLGLGELGREIALSLQRDGFEVRGWRRTPERLENIATYTGPGGLDAVVANSDIVLNVLPLTDETRHILSEELFARFRNGACLINMGRGAHLAESDLLAVLDSGKLSAATLDVTSIEPLPPDHPFWNHPAILITPHVAGSSVPMSAAASVAENIRRALAGEPLLHQVDLTRGY